MPDYIWIQNVVFPVLGMGMATIFGVMIIKTVNKVIDRKSGGGLRKQEIEELRASLEELRGELHTEIAELQERVDFAERALTSGVPRGPAAS
jgi:hypothetical protein